MGRKTISNVSNRQFTETAIENTTAYMMYYNRFLEIAISAFEWENTPSTVDTRYLEITLFTQGQSVWFRDDVVGELALSALIDGQFNVYGIPVNRRAIGYNGYQAELNIDNSVLIFNNMLHTNSLEPIREISKKLATLDRIIDVNINAQKTPILIQCDESQRLTLKNLYMKYDGNVPVIYGDKNLNPQALKVLTTGAPYLADKIYTLKTQYWNEALTYLGVSNMSTIKKAQQLKDEVNRSMGGTIASRWSRLESRQQGAKMVNEMFDENINVRFRDDFDDIALSETYNFMEDIESEREGLREIE